jgi:hypothetical protein
VKRTTRSLGLALLASAVLAAPAALPARAQDDEANKPAITGGVEMDVNSRYVWRGIPFSKAAVLQPSAWVTWKDFTLTAWGNYPLTKEANQGTFNEADLYLNYSHSFGKLTVKPGLYFYSYPNQHGVAGTTEAELKFCYPVGSMTAYTTHTFDVGHFSGAYYGDLGITHSKNLGPKTTCDTGISVAWGSSKFMDAYTGLPKGGLGAITASLGFRHALGHGFYLRPHLCYSRLMDKDIRRQVHEGSLFTGGVALGWEF